LVKNTKTITFTVYEKSTKASEVKLGWNSGYSKTMSAIAKRLIAKYHKEGTKGKVESYVIG
jgi:hypothetical protein